jgi:hypothetical protein
MSGLSGLSAPSHDITDKPIGRGQVLRSTQPTDTLQVSKIEGSLRDDDFRGGIHNLDHSLNGAAAVTNDLGTASKAKSEGDSR